MKVIAISGKKCSGKDTVCDMMIQELSNIGKHCEKIGFADAIYEELASMIWPNTTVSKFMLKKKVECMKANKPYFRKGLQWWGTDYTRNMISKTYWVEALMRRLLASDTDYVLVNDVRFPDEFEAIKQIGGSIFRVVRGNNGELDSHESETALDNMALGEYTDIITNSTSLEELKIEVSKIIKHNKL